MSKEKEKGVELQIAKTLEMYSKYKELGLIVGHPINKEMHPLTLDEELESINPYYVRQDVIRYG